MNFKWKCWNLSVKCWNLSKKVGTIDNGFEIREKRRIDRNVKVWVQNDNLWLTWDDENNESFVRAIVKLLKCEWNVKSYSTFNISFTLIK